MRLAQVGFGEAGIMNTRRFTATAMSWRYVVLAGCTLALLAAIGPAGIGSTTASIGDASGSPVADAKPAQAPQPASVPQADETQQTAAAPQANDAPPAADAVQAIDARQAGNDELRAVAPPQQAEATPAAASPELAEAREVAIGNPDAATAAAEPPATNGDVTISGQAQAADEPQARFEIASADPSDMLLAEPPLAQATAATTQDQQPAEAAPTVDTVEVFDECFVVDICVDRYLWALYQRAPKEDKMKVSERRAVTVKRKGKMVTVMRTFTRLVDENFAWKDQAASNKVSMPIQDYVIGGMDRGFKLKLFHTLHAAQAAGLSPGITSAFRDDYRQAIATGLKAANDRSYHGGSYRGGYGHGLAADIVSVKGATRVERWAATETLWKWIDAHGKEFGIGRPYLSFDPPHVAPTDGQEYVSRRGGDKVRLAYATMKKLKHLAARHEHGSAKRTRSAASKAGPVRSARNGPQRLAQAKLHG
jgi:hypothetical protein